MTKMLQSELSVYQDIKYEKDETLIDIDNQIAKLVEERETFKEAIFSIEEELKVLRHKKKAESKKKYGKDLTSTRQIMAFVKENPNKYSASQLTEHFVKLGFSKGTIETIIWQRYQSKIFLKDENGFLYLNPNFKQEPHGEKTRRVKEALTHEWKNSVELSKEANVTATVLCSIVYNLNRKVEQVEVKKNFQTNGTNSYRLKKGLL